MMRFACGIEYDGSAYKGFQSQQNGPSIQDELASAISKVANEKIKIYCAGRTDTGVNAACQVIHFDSNSARTQRQWRLGVNSNLPRDIVVLWVRQVPDEFHARFSAIQRSYTYRIINRRVRPAINRHQWTWEMVPLDAELMNQAIKCLVGTHDFDAFRSSKCQSKQSVKSIYSASVARQGDLIEIEISGSGFLHHMVRNIAGNLIRIGSKKSSVEWMKEVLESKDRTRGAMTAAPNGLTFNAALYPDKFGLNNVTNIQ